MPVNINSVVLLLADFRKTILMFIDTSSIRSFQIAVLCVKEKNEECNLFFAPAFNCEGFFILNAESFVTPHVESTTAATTTRPVSKADALPVVLCKMK